MAEQPIPDDLEGGLNADTSSEHIATTTTLLVLATVFVGLRFVARRVHGASYASDDWAAVVALILTYITGAVNFAMIHYGLGTHAATLDLDTQENFFKWLLVFECVYVIGVAAVKIALLMMYLRIFTTRGFKISSYILGGLTIAWCLSICLVCIFQCDPIYRAWQPWVTIGKCIDLKASFIGNAIPNIATDVAIICLPIFQVWRLQVNMVQKLSLLGVFLMGAFVFFASIYRFTTIMQFDVQDTTWTLATACTWCVVEVAVGLISVCLPTLRPLLVKVSRKFASVADISKNGSRKYGSNKYGSNKMSGSNNTELVTIGGGGASRAGHFQVSDDESKDHFGVQTYVGRDYAKSHLEPGTSDDEVPLRPGLGQSRVVYVSQEFGRSVSDAKH